jgi:ubiquitin-conjugating enzyme E2 S
VCVETLKRDWSSTLKLRDVLVTISCLLIQPNPASALNEDAGKLASEDWEGFCRRARLMAGIHAQVPRGIGEAVREAQMRGEEQDVGEAKKEINSKVGRKGKGKEKVETPVVAEKASQTPVEDEENRKRRSETVGVESDPESDWIPGPVKISKPFAAPRLSDNVFGIKGMDNSTLDTPSTISGNADPQVIRGKVQTADADGFNLPDPVLSQPIKHHSFSLRVAGSSSMNPSSSTSPHKSSSESTSTTTINSHPLLQEFSYSWQDSQVLHSTGFTKNGLTKAEVRKRLASEEFEKQRVWELKRFKAAGYDLKRYNRGDFGPRTGIGRL